MWDPDLNINNDTDFNYCFCRVIGSLVHFKQKDLITIVSF